MDLRTGHVSFPNEFVDFRRTKKVDRINVYYVPVITGFIATYYRH